MRKAPRGKVRVPEALLPDFLEAITVHSDLVFDIGQDCPEASPEQIEEYAKTVENDTAPMAFVTIPVVGPNFLQGAAEVARMLQEAEYGVVVLVMTQRQGKNLEARFELDLDEPTNGAA
jgi:hypothetical protein